MEVFEKINEIRKQKRMSYAELGRLTKTSRIRMFNYLNGRTNITIEILIALAEALDFEISEVLPSKIIHTPEPEILPVDHSTFAVTENLLLNEISTIEYQRIGKKMMICLITTKNGHEVIGQSGIIDHRKFSEEEGRTWSLFDAKNNLARLLAYQVQGQLHKHLNNN